MRGVAVYLELKVVPGRQVRPRSPGAGDQREDGLNYQQPTMFNTRRAAADWQNKLITRTLEYIYTWWGNKAEVL